MPRPDASPSGIPVKVKRQNHPMRKLIALFAVSALLGLLVFQSVYMPYAYAQILIPNNGGGPGGASGPSTQIQAVTLAQLALITCDGSYVGGERFVTDAPVSTGGTHIYLCNGTSWLQQGSVGNADGSITLVSTGGLIDIQVTSGVFACLNCNNTFASNSSQDFQNAYMLPPTKEFADLPAAASVTGTVFVVEDCLTAACAAGGGTIKSWVRSNGATYDVVSPGSTGVTVTGAATGRTFPSVNAAGTVIDFNPGLPSINNGFNIAVGPSISYYLNGLGNVTTCATTAAIQSYSNAAAFDLTGNCTLTGPATAYASVTFSPIYVIACADGSNRDLIPPANFLGWTPGTAGTLTANTCSGALFVGYGNYFYALGSFANQVK